MSEPEEARKFLEEFLTHVRSNNAVAAGECIVASAYPNGVDAVPSPRAQGFIDSGEWDVQKDPVPLFLVTEKACRGRIGTSEPMKICIKSQGLCTTENHRRTRIHRTGWMIGAGTKVSDGAYCSLILPEAEKGGPIDEIAALRLQDGENPFRLKVTFWKFVFQAYAEDLTGLVDPTPPRGDRSEFIRIEDPTHKDLEVSPLPSPLMVTTGIEFRSDDGFEKPLSWNTERIHVLNKFSGIKDEGEGLDDADSGVLHPAVIALAERFFACPRETFSHQLVLFMNEFLEAGASMTQERAVDRTVGFVNDVMIAKGQYLQAIDRLEAERRRMALENGAQAALILRMEKRIEGLERAVQASRQESASLQARVVGMANNPADILHIKRVADEAAELANRALSGLAAREGSSGMSPNSASSSVIDQLREDVASAASTARSAKSDVAALTAATAFGKPVNFYRYSFSGYPEFLKFADVHNIELGCTADAFVLLHGSSGVVTSRDAMKDRKVAKDNDMATPLQCLIVGSFASSVPEAFSPHKGAGDNSSNATKEVLKRSAKTFAAWEDDSGLNGMRFQLERSIENIRERVTLAAFSSSLTSDGQALCSALLTDSVAFATSFVEFFTRFYPMTKKTSSLAEADIWDLCLEVMAYILDEIATARNKFCDKGDMNPAYFVWGMIEAWKVQQRYRSHKFINDPALNGIFVRRAVLRSLDQRIGIQIRELYQKLAVVEHQQAAGAVGVTPPGTPKAKKKRVRKKKGAALGAGEPEEDSESTQG